MLPPSAADARAKRRVPMGVTVVHLSLMGSYLQVTSIMNVTDGQEAIWASCMSQYGLLLHAMMRNQCAGEFMPA